MLTPLDEHALLVFWTQLLVLVAAARALGYVTRRVGLPSVIGQLAAGVILGPSVFGAVWPGGFEWFIPEEVISSGALFAVTWLGVALLLVTAGFETDLELIRRLGRAAALVTGFSLVVPLAGGLVTGLLLPEDFVGGGADRTVFALFVAAALSVSALAVIARILSELGLMRRDFGQITVAAGMANDVVGWVMIAVFTGFATAGEVSLGGTLRTVLGLAAFLALAMTLGQRAVDAGLRRIRRDGPNIQGALSLAVMTMLVFGVSTQALGIEAVLGAFVAGVVLNRSRFQQHEVVQHIESLTNAFLAPVFFAMAGLRMDLGLLGDSEALLWAGAVMVVAIVAKFAGAFVGARLAGQSRRAASALGAGLNARGALEIVIASVGLSLGVFSETAYTVIVLVPLVTSVFAAVSLRLVVRDWIGSPDEVERLEREEALSRNLVVRSSRLLLASRSEPASIAAAQLMHFAWPVQVPATVVSVTPDSGADDRGAERSGRFAGSSDRVRGRDRIGDASSGGAASAVGGAGVVGAAGAAESAAAKGRWPDIAVIRSVLDGREVDHRQLRAAGSDAAAVAGAIVAEARLGYGAICVGVAVRHDAQLYSPLVDELLLNSPLPVVIVRRALSLETPLPGAFTRAIVPVTGTRSSSAAQEVAFGVSSQLGTEVVLTHVVQRPWAELQRLPRRLARSRLATRVLGESSTGDTRPVVDALMDAAQARGAEMGVAARTLVSEGATAATTLVSAAAEQEADLVVLGASLRNVDGRPFLGHTVETVLEQCPANVAVVALPRPSTA
ncbi:MAG: cation:proton antiporter [Acidimicrobiaceae bacterium]|nr:cation:proton antiporter [Acidimicrobiaceae bacterium]